MNEWGTVINKMEQKELFSETDDNEDCPISMCPKKKQRRPSQGSKEKYSF